MRGMGRLWQAAGTVRSILQPGLMEKAAACGLRSLFVGFETLSPANLQGTAQGPQPTPGLRRRHPAPARPGRDGQRQLCLWHGRGRRIVFDRTVEWAIEQGIETATFHILTPYPGTALHERIVQRGAHLAHGLEAL